MPEREVVYYKPHKCKVSILTKSFDPKVHCRLDRVADIKEEPKEELRSVDEVTQQDCTDEEMRALWEEYRVKYGKMPVGRWKADIRWLKGKLEA